MTFKDKAKLFTFEMSFVLAESYAYASVYVDAYVAHFAASFCLTFCLDPFCVHAFEGKAKLFTFEIMLASSENQAFKLPL